MELTTFEKIGNFELNKKPSKTNHRQKKETQFFFFLI